MKETNTPPSTKKVTFSNKKRRTYCWLALLGFFGIHNFYVGRYIQAIFQLIIGLFSFTLIGLILLFYTFIPVCIWIICNVLLTKTDGKGNPLIPCGVAPRVIAAILVPFFIIITVVVGIMGKGVVRYATAPSWLGHEEIFIQERR